MTKSTFPACAAMKIVAVLAVVALVASTDMKTAAAETKALDSRFARLLEHHNTLVETVDQVFEAREVADYSLIPRVCGTLIHLSKGYRELIPYMDEETDKVAFRHAGNNYSTAAKRCSASLKAATGGNTEQAVWLFEQMLGSIERAQKAVRLPWPDDLRAGALR